MLTTFINTLMSAEAKAVCVCSLRPVEAGSDQTYATRQGVGSEARPAPAIAYR